MAQWPIDVLINNAGMGQTGPLVDVPMERIRAIFEVNVFGTLAITQKVLAGMIERGSGRVIVMSSIGGLHSFPAFGPYNMTKHALEGMGKCMRIEMEPHGIDVCMMGCNDLSLDLGYPGQGGHPEVQNEVRKVVDACKQAKIASGNHIAGIDTLRYWMGQGMQMITYNYESNLIIDKGKEALKTLKEGFVD